MCDGFGAIRARVAGVRNAPARSPASIFATGPDAPADGGIGRAVGPGSAPAADGVTATTWLKRWPSSCCAGGAWCSGTWPCTTRCACPWREIQWALRRLEDRGLVRGGRFVGRFQRRAVRPARGRRATGPCPQDAAHRGAGGGQRHRSPQPGGTDRARGRSFRPCGPTGSPTSTGFRSRPNESVWRKVRIGSSGPAPAAPGRLAPGAARIRASDPRHRRSDRYRLRSAGGGPAPSRLWPGDCGQYTQTSVPMGARLSAQIQLMASLLTRAQPWETGLGGT